MTNQIFKNIVPNSLIFNFLDKICLFKHTNHYIIDDSSYKKAIFLNILKSFCDNLKNYYHKSKHHYITRDLNYSKLMTIIRQICKKNKIAITSQIKYDKSKYCINYFIYF
tara:strand:+ start:377 stop:706 length:330 start_codon:yes stop_codon:yes gene_type:complete